MSSAGTKSESCARLPARSTKPSPLVKVPTAIAPKIGHGKRPPHDLRHGRERRHRHLLAGELRRRQHGENGGGEQSRDLRARKRRDQHAVAGRRGNVDDDAEQEREEIAAQRHPENQQGHQEHQPEIDHREADIGELLADQKLDAPDRRDVEIGDRAELLFAHDGERHQNRRKQREHHGNGRRHHGVNAVEILIVFVSDLDASRRLRREQVRGRDHRVAQIELVDGLQVAADGLGAKRHGAVDPGADEGRTPTFDVAAEAGRNFDRGVDVAALHARVQIGVTVSGGFSMK